MSRIRPVTKRILYKRSVQCHVFAQLPPGRHPINKYPFNTSHRSRFVQKFFTPYYLVATVIHIVSTQSKICVCLYIHTHARTFFVALRPNADYDLSFVRFLDHTQRRTTVGSTPRDERSARRRDLYLTTHNTHDRHPCPDGIRTHNLSRRAAADLRLRPRLHWDLYIYTHILHNRDADRAK